RGLVNVRCVVVNIDNVVKNKDRRLHGALQLGLIEFAVNDVLCQVHGAQVTDGNFFVGLGVERNLGTQVGRVDHTGVLLRAAQVARVFKSHPGVAGFKQHTQHLAPQVQGTYYLVDSDLAFSGELFV